MAVFTTAASGNFSAGATWVGGIKPPSAAGNSIINALGHVLNYDEAAGEYGDDTNTAFQVNGTFKFDPTVSTQLTVVGLLQTAAATTATFDMGRRSTSSRIPAGINSVLILNKSSAMANYKYGIFIAESSNAYFGGVAKTRNSATTTLVSGGGTSVGVADATNWGVGDWVIIGETSGVMSQYDRVQIVTITPTGGTAATITFAALSFAHASGAPIGNFSSNVVIKSFNTTNPAFICCRYTSTASNLRRELDDVSFEYVGSDVSLTSTKVFISSGLSTEANPFLTFESCSFYQGGNSILLFQNQLNTTKIYRNHAFFSDVAAAGAMIYTGSGTYCQYEDCVFYYMRCVGINSGFSQGGQGAAFRRCKFWANGTNFSVNLVNGSGLEFVDCQWHSAEPTGVAFASLGSGDATFTTCSFGGSDLVGTPACGYIFDAGSVSGQVGTFQFNDCRFMTPATSFYRRITTANPKYKTFIANKNLDPLVQEVYTPNGTIVRDNTSKISGVTSLKLSPVSATNALTFTLDVPAPNGKLVAVTGLLNRDTANTATVTLSGLGITPLVYTAAAAININETFFVYGTNNTGTDGILTLTISVTGASGNMWVDSIAAPQAAAINFGEFDYWARALPASIVTANYVSSGDIWNYVLDGTFSAAQLMKIKAATTGGKLSGASTTTEIFRNPSDTKNVVTATVDRHGNRTSITYDVT